MKPFQRILVPLDFSEHSEGILEVAADLSRRYEAAVTLVYVYESPMYKVPESAMLVSQPQLDELLGAFRKHLVAAQRRAEAAGAARVRTELLEGPVAIQIRDFAQQGAFDLIVMGTHGRTGLDHLLIGSVAEHVVRTAPCPVLTVRIAAPVKAL